MIPINSKWFQLTLEIWNTLASSDQNTSLGNTWGYIVKENGIHFDLDICSRFLYFMFSIFCDHLLWLKIIYQLSIFACIHLHQGKFLLCKIGGFSWLGISPNWSLKNLSSLPPTPSPPTKKVLVAFRRSHN